MTQTPEDRALTRTASTRFRTAPEHGVLYSHASTQVYPDLVDGPFTSLPAAEERMEAVLRAQGGPTGVQAVLMARSPGEDWLSRSGHSATDLIRHHVETGNRLGQVPQS